jgi:Tfp pilus assembly protein PilO
VKIENRQQFLLIAAVAVVALFASDRLILGPMARAWKSRSQTVASLRSRISEGASLIRREQAVRARWEQMRTNALPNDPSRAQEQLLKALEAWSQESGVSLNAVTPQWKDQASEYQTLVCRVDASGTLWTLSRFLHDIEKDPMALKVEAVDISTRDNTGRQLTLGLQVSGLVLTPQTR